MPGNKCGRSEVAAALFQKTEQNGIKSRRAYYDIAELCKETDADTVFCGELAQSAIDD
jgi:hypothetical protein